MSAAAYVLHTPELLGIILAELPATSILRCQRVSKFWLAQTLSPPISHKLFFTIRPRTPRVVHEERELNSLLKQYFPAFFLAPKPIINAFPFHTLFATEEVCPWFSDLHLREIFLRKEASWRKMILFHNADHDTHVQLSQLAVIMRDINADDPLESKAFVECPQGVTMGLLWDLMTQELEMHVTAKGFLVRWPTQRALDKDSHNQVDKEEGFITSGQDTYDEIYEEEGLVASDYDMEDEKESWEGRNTLEFVVVLQEHFWFPDWFETFPARDLKAWKCGGNGEEIKLRFAPPLEIHEE